MKLFPIYCSQLEMTGGTIEIVIGGGGRGFHKAFLTLLLNIKDRGGLS